MIGCGGSRRSVCQSGSRKNTLASMDLYSSLFACEYWVVGSRYLQVPRALSSVHQTLKLRQTGTQESGVLQRLRIVILSIIASNRESEGQVLPSGSLSIPLQGCSRPIRTCIIFDTYLPCWQPFTVPTYMDVLMMQVSIRIKAIPVRPKQTINNVERPGTQVDIDNSGSIPCLVFPS